MPTIVGPNTKGEENLVFGYDLGDTSNSYKGQPATNLITSGIPGYFGSGGQTLYQERLYGLKSDSGIFQRNYVTNPATSNTSTFNNNGGLYKNFTTSGLNAATRYVQISFDFYMITRYRTYSSSDTGLNGYLGITNTDSTTDIYFWNTTYSNGSGDDWSNNEAYVGQWQKVSLIAALRGDKNPASINAMYIYYDRFTQGEGIFTNFIITEHQGFPTGPVRYTAGTRSATTALIDLTGNSTIDLSNVSFDSNGQVDYDGSNDYINLGSSLNSIGSNATFEMVFKAEETNDNYRIMLGWGNGNSNYSGIHIGSWTSGYTDESFHVSFNSGALILYVRKGHTFYKDNTYHHAIVTASPGNYAIWIDGVEQTLTYGGGNQSTTFDNIVGYNANIVAEIGRRPYGGGTGYFNGKLPLMKIYDRILTDSEIQANYNAIKGRFNI